MADKESYSIWDHITGKCFQGKHEGKQLAYWHVRLTTVEAALADDPDLTISLSNFNGFKARFMQGVYKGSINSKGFIPPMFKKTMAGEIDGRLPKMTQGLGVIVDEIGKFYPMNLLEKGESIEDVWQERPLRITRGAIDGVLTAVWLDTNEMPMQLLSRWYGFSFTYIGCDIYGSEQ